MRQTQQAKTTLSQPECMQSILGVYNQIEMICQGVQCALILILFLLPLSGLSFRLKRKKKEDSSRYLEGILFASVKRS